jgi:hypothetical protein
MLIICKRRQAKVYRVNPNRCENKKEFCVKLDGEIEYTLFDIEDFPPKFTPIVDGHLGV